MKTESTSFVISSNVIMIMVFATWVLFIVLLVGQAHINTEHKMRIGMLEDEVLGQNIPVTHTLKSALQQGGDNEARN